MTEEQELRIKSLFDRFYKDIYHYGKDHYGEVPDQLKVTQDEFHLLLVYKHINTPLYIKVNQMGGYKISCWGIPVTKTS